MTVSQAHKRICQAFLRQLSLHQPEGWWVTSDKGDDVLLAIRGGMFEIESAHHTAICGDPDDALHHLVKAVRD